MYALIGFLVFRRVGYSQVYDVITPFVLVSGFMIHQTYRICASDTRSATAFYFFSLPHHRQMAFYAHLTLLSLGGLWLIAIVFLGCALKLGGRVSPRTIVFIQRYLCYPSWPSR